MSKEKNNTEDEEVDNNEDPYSPFYGLTDGQKDELMKAIQKQDKEPSKIKGRPLKSRKEFKGEN